ncbi:hypothetical protein N2152v2_009116 [Parachlorella kessleri]
MGKDKKKHKDRKDRHHEKKPKKRKKSKRSRRRDNSSSETSSDSDEGRVLNVNTQLAKSRAAARAAREVLAYNYQLKGELRELVRQLDSGGALDVSGIPDQFLRSKLCTLFDNLVQLRKNSAGQYFKQRGAAPVLAFIAPILDESPASLAAYAPPAAAAATPQNGTPAVAGQAQAIAGAAGPEGRPARGPVGPTLPPERQPQEQQQQVEGQQQPQGVEEDGRQVLVAGPEVEGREAPGRPAAVHIGPQLGPRQAGLQEGLVASDGESEEGEGPASGAANGELAEEMAAAGSAGSDDAVAVAAAAAAAKRVLGPSMPTQQQLEAAAQMEFFEEEEGGLDELLVGPAPPELAEEVDAASMDERSAEVVRIIKVLQQHANALEGSTAAQAAEQLPDPYEVLGVDDEATAGDVKKRYWRLSLLIHPDKCDHPQAHDAFQAVARAAKELQDSGLRKLVDDRRQEKALRAEFEKEQAAAERQRQWRVMRGQATAEDLAGPSQQQFGGPSREAWMTELPPERKAGGALPSLSTLVGFSKAGVKGRGDTSDWTLTPAQRAAQLEGGPGAGQGPMLIPAGPAEGAAQQRLQRTAAAVDQYNLQARKKSLLEQHLDKQQEPEKKKRKKEKGAGKKQAAAAEQDWDATQHPWRPFDREKDLGPGLKGPANPQDLLQNAKALGSKFSGGQGSTHRTFL